jgi:hypothetical protein
MTEKEFLRLLRFYLACVEAEDRRSLTTKLSTLHRSLVSPWDDEEPLFHSEAPEVVLEVSHASDRDLLLRGTEAVAGTERFYYGYPIFLDEDGFLSPLFFTEVALAHMEDDRFVIRCGGELQLNHHVLARRGTPPEELRAIRADVEGEHGSFAIRLRAAFDALGLATLRFDRAGLEPFPEDDSHRNRWVNRPILFRSERRAHTHHLRRELEALARYPRLFNALGTTAAGVVAGFSAPDPMYALGPTPDPPRLLQVLPLNGGQENAARAALRAPLAVVTGPPGTGKSQMVVDLLASCAMAGQPVLFSSNNNRAVDVVRDRLRSTLGHDRDWTLRLGSRQVMDESRQDMSARLGALRPDDARPRPPSRLLRKLGEAIARTERRLREVERATLEYARLETDRRAAARLVDSAWVDSWTGDCPPLPDQSRVVRLTAMAEALAGRRRAGIWLTLKRALAPSAVRRLAGAELASLASMFPPRVRNSLTAIAERRAGDPFASLAEACGKLAALVRWRAAENACGRALHVLTSWETSEALTERLDTLRRRRAAVVADQLGAMWTRRLAFQAAAVRDLVSRYFDLSSRLRQNRGRAFFHVLDHFTRTVRSLGTSLPIWIVTNLSVRNALPLEPALFDLVILDEGSQCGIPSALPLLFRARRVLIIGDPRQLGHISTLSCGEEERLAAEHDVVRLLATWSYTQRSIYALAERRVLEQGGEPLFLAEHYRSHPDIVRFSNHAFYQGRLIVRTAVETLRRRLEREPLGLHWHDIRGSVTRSPRSAVNELEVQAVLDLLDEWSSTGFLLRDGVDFGIVTPFRLQMERLAEAVRTRPWWEQVKQRVTVGTAHRFQGDERDVMIFSPVVAQGMQPRLVRWVADDDQLLNVAITRARAALHVVGDLRACAASGGFLSDFASTIVARCR